MKIGIISDTHDNLSMIAAAVKLFNRLKTDFVVHAGDFVAPFTVPEINKLKCPWKGVFGNNDGERKGLFSVSGGKITEAPLSITFASRKIVVVHDIALLDGKMPHADILIYGHSHKPSVKRKGSILTVNPGECGGWLRGKSTVAVVDTVDLSAEVVGL
ncbi:MAG: metallophosphoesterase [Candidatus Omnitrophota bacterium]|jgi:putative phosphoesterase|nr:metallophosphoesterase [Candidatus Omnitrophota bacterium]MDD5527270.1 metallophosphoesterase [Candidatus Omnitrophota bacterium]